MLKEYHERTPSILAKVAEQSSVTLNYVIQYLDFSSSEREVSEDMINSVVLLKNFDVFANLNEKLRHLSLLE